MVIGWYGYFSLYVTGTDFICENLLFQVLQALFSKYGSIDVNFYAPEIEDRGGGGYGFCPVCHSDFNLANNF